MVLRTGRSSLDCGCDSRSSIHNSFERRAEQSALSFGKNLSAYIFRVSHVSKRRIRCRILEVQQNQEDHKENRFGAASAFIYGVLLLGIGFTTRAKDLKFTLL